MSQRLTSAVRDVDHVARVGGDEFVALCLGERRGTNRLAERISAHLNEEPYRLGAESAEVACSVGLSHSVGTYDVSSMLSEADHSMYRAKTLMASKRLRGMALS